MSFVLDAGTAIPRMGRRVAGTNSLARSAQVRTIIAEPNGWGLSAGDRDSATLSVPGLEFISTEGNVDSDAEVEAFSRASSWRVGITSRAGSTTGSGCVLDSKTVALLSSV